MKYKLVINNKEVSTYTTFMSLFGAMQDNIKPGDHIEIYQRARKDWSLMEGWVVLK